MRSFRASISTMGDGFVECIDSNTLAAISNAQPLAQRGTVIQVPVNEAGGRLRVGRFGSTRWASRARCNPTRTPRTAARSPRSTPSPIQGTRNQIRTAPLWGLRTKSRLMHDGATVTRFDAIQRHGGQASASRTNFNNLSSSSQNDLLIFLNSL